MIDRLRLKPWAVRSFRFVAVLISSTQSCSRLDSRRCRSFNLSMGALIVRSPPFRFGIWKVVYLVASGSLYKMYETAFGLKSSSSAKSLRDFAAFR